MPRKDPKCKQSDSCKYKTHGHCITEKKDGLCPVPSEIANIKKGKACMVDSECLGANKCCNSTCITPCQTTRCTCQANTVVKNHLNAKGCPLCSCVKKEEENPCKLKKDTGPCKAAIKKFYYDVDSKNCKEFKYGGCFGNQNKFDSKETCTNKCQLNVARVVNEGGNETKSVDLCLLPKEVGLCKAAKHRFYFDATKKIM